MSSQIRKRRTFGLVAAFSLAALALLVTSPRRGWSDDRDLLVSGLIKPYLFIILDSSGSMNLKIGGAGEPTLGFGDDPDSRIYAAKEALYQVFADRDDVHFGFATFDQDHLRVFSKHYLYPVDTAARAHLDDNGWPLASWPLPDPDGDPVVTLGVDCNGDGTPDGSSTSCFDGDALVFGRSVSNFMPAANDGTCLEPIDLDTERDRLNAFPRLGSNGTDTTTLWISQVRPGGGNVDTYDVYRLTFAPGSAGSVIGDPSAPLAVTFIAEELDQSLTAWPGDCAAPDLLEPVIVPNVQLTLDPLLSQFLMVDNPGPDLDFPEEAPGHWLAYDAVSTATCGNGKPFTGLGMEGNYDSGTTITGPGSAAFNDEVTNEDAFCTPAIVDGSAVGVTPDATDPDTCVEMRPLRPTELSSLGRFADRGDLLPFDWDDSNKTEFLRRLAPNYPFGDPDFGVSTHLTDTLSQGADNLGTAIGLAPRLAGRPPIIANGVTPLGKAMLDFRCWYTGSETPDGRNVPKCDAVDETPFFAESGWAGAACDLDPEFGCRRPFLILISDGIDTCAGESPVADISDLKTKTGLKTWALNLGPEKNCQAGGAGNVLHSVTTAGDGECVNVTSKEDLLETLESIATTIVSSAQSFAAAAVPTVQSNASTRIFLSSFRAVPDASTWDGHLSSFWKPLPTDGGTPDTGDIYCEADDGRDDTPAPGDGCHLWDAGVELLGQFDDTDPLDANDGTKRRVFYSRQTTSGDWPNTRRLLDPTNGDGGVANDALRYDLWRAFDMIPAATPDNSLDDANERELERTANAVIDASLDKHDEVLSDGTVISYLLGDIFHSRPGLIEAPPNTRFFAENAGENVAGACAADESAANFNRGYRCFLERQLNRRRVLVVGANDGLLHGFDAGTYDHAAGLDQGMACDPGNDPPGSSACGTGKELWAYMPREVMPTVRERTEVDGHKFSVDASPSLGDVFIDPLHDGTPTPGDRLWRTVVITGLREGGSGYFALDVTQPEPLTDADPTSGLHFVPIEGSGEPAVAGCSKVPIPAGCGPVPYPAALWEFGDTTHDSHITVAPTFPVRMDEDANGAPDLGDTWSLADIGRIRICAGAECDPNAVPNNVIDKHVAIFTGGMDQLNKSYDPRSDFDPGIQGNWLYIVDIETGKAIYKRRLDSASPSDPAAVDTNQDGYINRIYAGTLAGSLYRVDLAPDASGSLPQLSGADNLFDLDGNQYDGVARIMVDSNGDPAWVPRKIFDANFNASGGGLVATSEPRPLHHPPSVFFVTELGLYGIAFGTGDREDLWGRTPEGDAGALQEGRFFLFVDDTDFVDPADLPLTEDHFQLIDLAAFDPDTGNLLTTRPAGQKGWYLALEEKERVSAQAFNLLGVTFFSSFVAEVATTNPKTCDNDDIRNENTCSKSGFSKVFVTSTVNARPFVTDPNTADPFFKIAGAFVSEPFTEIGYSSGSEGGDSGGGGGPGGGGGGGPGGGSPGGGDDLTDDEEAVMDALRDLFPENCRFTNQRIDVRLVTSDTQVRRIAAVPVCVIEKNWKEF